MKESPTRAVVFDLFHTLVDPEDYRPKDFRRVEVLTDLLGADRGEFIAYWKKTAIQRRSTPRHSVEYVREFQEMVGKPTSEQVLAEADEVIGRYQDLAILNPREEVVVCLKSLKRKGLKLGLLSNAEEREVRSWPTSPLAPHFDFSSFSFNTGKLKPELAAYRTVLKGLKAAPEASAYVGDGGDQELLGARRANFGRVILMRRFVSKNGLRTDEELREFAKQSDLVVDDFQGLSRSLNVRD
jgi:putative hydrolase of the HAD superfamily